MKTLRRSVVPSVLLAVAGLFFTTSASAATISWNTTSSGNWNTPGNWSPPVVPGGGDDVVITLAGTYTVTLDVGASVNSLTLGGASGVQTLAIGGSSLSLAAASTVNVNGVIALSGNTLGGAGTLTVDGVIDWTGGTIGTSGATTVINAGGTLNIGGGADKVLSQRTVNNNGTINWTGGRIFLQNSPVINNNAGALFDIQCSSEVTSSAVGGTIVNNGTVRKSATVGATTSPGFIGWVNHADIDIASGIFQPGSLTLNTGGDIKGTGLRIDGGSMNVAGTASVTGLMTLASGSITGAGTLSIDGSIDWTGGSFLGAGSTDIPSGGLLTATGGADKVLDARTINNAGDFVWDQGRIFFQNNGTFNNQATGTFDIRVDNVITSSAIGGTLNNVGLIVKSTGAGTATVQTFIQLNNNAGTIDVPSGTLAFHKAFLNNGTQITGTGYLINAGTTTVTGTATVVGTATLTSGTVNGAGDLSITGVFDWQGGVFDGAGTTTVEAGGEMNVESGSDHFLDVREIENFGTTNWTGGRILFQNGGIFENEIGGVFDAKQDNQFTSSAIGGTFRNFGTFQKTAGAGNVFIASFIAITNTSGTFDVTSGAIVIDSTMTVSGTTPFTGTGTTQITGTITGTATIAGTQLVLAGTMSGATTITLAGEMAWSSGTLATNGGVLAVNAGATLNIGSGADKFLDRRTINNSGTVNWTGGRILFQNNGVFNNLSGALFEIFHDSQFTSSAIGGTFTNDGTFRKSGAAGATSIASFIAFNNNSATIEVNSGSIVMDSANFVLSGTNDFPGNGGLQVTGTMSGSGTITGELQLAGTIGGGGALTIDGILVWSSGTMAGAGSTTIGSGGTLRITSGSDHFLNPRTLNNNGLIDWNGGRILFQNNAILNNNAGATFETQHDSQFTSSAIGGQFRNFGTFVKHTGTGATSIASFIAFTSDNALWDVQSGTLVIDSTMTIVGTSNFTGAGTTNVSGAITGTGTMNGELTLTGTITGAGVVTVGGTLNWLSGTMSGGGSTNIASGGVLDIENGSDHFLNPRSLNNAGTVNWIQGRIFFQNNPVFTNQAGGVFNVLVDSQWTSSAVGGSFVNAGTFTKGTPGTVSTAFVTFANSGLTDIQSGSFDTSNRTYTQTAGTTIVGGELKSSNTFQFQGGVAMGGGTITGTVNNTGADFQPGTSTATLTVSGNYTQSAGANLTIEIEGVGQADKLAIGGTFFAGGDLNIISPYTPSDGDVFQVMTFGARSGDFANKNGLNLGGGMVYTPAYSGTDLTLTAEDASANLFVTQSDTPDPVNLGDDVTYTITITNGAATGATGVMMDDTLPAGATFVSATASQGSCTGTGPVNCTIGALGAGASATVDLVLTPSAAGTITNTAVVDQNEADPNTTNNTFDETTTVNGPPVATDDSCTTNEDTPVTLPVLANDTDPELDTLTIDSFGQPNDGTVTCTTTDCTYTPDADFSGNDSFTYTVRDPGGLTDSAVATINVNAVNDAPVANDDAINGGPSGGSVNVLVNDTDVDFDTLTVTSNSNGSQGTVSCTPAGDCTYTPGLLLRRITAAAVTNDSFTYTVQDGSGATDVGTVNVTLTAVNSPPVAVDDSYRTETGLVTRNVLANDSDPDGDPFTLLTHGDARHGTVSCQSDGDCTYEAEEGFFGPDSFTYKIGDGISGTDEGLVTIRVERGDCPTNVELLAPLRDARGVPTSGQLRWDDANADYYIVRFGLAGQTCELASGRITAETSLAYSDLLPDTEYEWSVEAVANGCTNVRSVCSRFRTAKICTIAPPTLLSPLGGTAGGEVTFSWSEVANAIHYKLFVAEGGGAPTERATVTTTSHSLDIEDGEVSWYVVAEVPDCGPLQSSTARFNVCEGVGIAPVPSVVAEATTEQTYRVAWTPVPNAVEYVLEEAGDAHFNNPTITRTASTSVDFTRSAANAARAFFYRVRAILSCSQVPGPYSAGVRIVITPLPPRNSRNPHFNIPVGNRQVVVQELFVPGDPVAGSLLFAARTDQDWITVEPSSGTLHPEGITLQLLADPADLPNGTTTGTVIITTSPLVGLSAIGTTGATTTSVPVSVSLVTPVTPAITATPPPHALIIPSVGHLDAVASQWQSDVRVTNTSSEPLQYQLTFTPSTVDLEHQVKSTIIDVEPGTTTALDDIVRTWFGHGSLAGDAAVGYLEIRPLTTAANVTVASSRTYSFTPNGTLGQFVPPIPFSAFIGASDGSSATPVLSLQQIAQSSAYRTNIGLVEASGFPASVVLSVFDKSGSLLKNIPVELGPGKLEQMNSLLATHGIALDDGRVEVRVADGVGKVTAYASTVDNGTNDPLLVSGVLLGQVVDHRWVLPGAADIDTGTAKWQTDLRVFNPGSEAQIAKATYYPEKAALIERTITIAAHEVLALDGVVRQLFGQTQSGGAIHVETPNAANLVVSARTYNATSTGTFGLFVPGVTPQEAVGAADRTLHIPQVEESVRYRANIGIAEVTGKPVVVQVGLVRPDTKVTPTFEFDLGANEFRQFTSIIRSLGGTNVYNARITVRVVSGDGRITAYGSVIDLATQDPTFVPGL